MRSLEDLNVDGCSSLNNFPEIECEMKSLTSIKFGGTGIKELPPSIRYLTRLRRLSLDACINLTNLPSSIYELQHLEYLSLDKCSKLAKFPKKIRDGRQSMPPPTNSSVSIDDRSSKVFPALKALYLNNCVLLESADFLEIFNCYSTLNILELSGSGIVTIPACIKRFVALWGIKFHGCKQLREIQAFPPMSGYVDAKGCMSLELYNKCWLPELSVVEPVGSRIGVEASSINNITPVGGEAYQNEPTSFLDEGLFEKKHFYMVVSGNKVPDWFSYRNDQVSNSNSCEVDIDVPPDLDGEISRIVYSAVIEKKELTSSIYIYVISDVQISCSSHVILGSDCVWMYCTIPDPCELEKYNGHLIVKFVYESDHLRAGCGVIKGCGVHLVRRCEEKAKEYSIGGTQVTKRPRNDDDKDDDNLESNCYPQQKRHSSTWGIII